MEKDRLKIHARRAYEFGRFSDASFHALGTVVLVAVSLLVHGVHQHILALGGLAFVLHLLAGITHRDYLMGAWLGVGLGGAQLLAASFMWTIGMRFVPQWCQELCFVIVFLGSSGVAFLYAKHFVRAAAISAARGGAAMMAIGVTVAPVGCLPGSVGLLMGSALGLAMGLWPAWLLLRTRVS